MARPTKTQDYLVHRIADLFRILDYFDDYFGGAAGRHPIEERKPPIEDGKQNAIKLRMADGQWVTVNSRDDVVGAVGRLLCDLKPEVRPQIIGKVADALEGKYGAKRKAAVDDVAKIWQAYFNAKAKL